MQKMVTGQMTRRTLLRGMAYIGAALAVGPRISSGMSANSKLNLACVGVGGKGASDIMNMHACDGVSIVALCDVDKRNLARAAAAYPKARTFADFRRMLEAMDKSIDALTVSTPDHMHAPISLAAMARGKHVFCQKPLCHDLWECRRMQTAPAQFKVATQMGIQCHSMAAYRQAVLLIRSGIIGKVKKVNCWTCKGGRARIPQPPPTDPPAYLHWDLWLGVALARPYIRGEYHPDHWRAYADFGEGELGDMGCHIIDTPWFSLELGPPLSAVSQNPGFRNGVNPVRQTVHYTFAPTRYTAADFKLTFYEAMPLPRDLISLLEGDKIPKEGAILIGEKGVMLLPHVEAARLYPSNKFRDLHRPKPVKIHNHDEQFITACRGGSQKPTSSFDTVGGPLTELVLVGVVAGKFPGQKLEWDSVNLRFNNFPEANACVRRTYRKGWELENLC